MPLNIIDVADLIKRYKKEKSNAVDGISLSVREGEFYAFLGPNGAGKTTTISILTTTLSPTSGRVVVTGYDIARDAAKVRQNIGVIFQNPSLDLNLTAEENIRFHASLYNIYPFRPTYSFMPKSYKDKVSELAAVIGIENEIGKPVRGFSGGMKRKLEIIRSLMHDPKVLFLDEPTAGLDPASRKNLWKYLEKVRKTKNTTVFLTTHYLEEAEDADRVAVIVKGKIVSAGTPAKLKRVLTDDYIIISSTDNLKLENELKTKGIKYSSLNGRLKVDIDALSVHAIISSIKTPLNHIDIYNPTLEEAYLKLITEPVSD